MRIGRSAPSTGVRRLRRMSAVSALSGEIYSVCKPLWVPSANSARLGRNPASVFPPPVGAIKSVDFAPEQASISIWCGGRDQPFSANHRDRGRSEEHTSELQSQSNLVCRLLLEEKSKKTN